MYFSKYFSDVDRNFLGSHFPGSRIEDRIIVPPGILYSIGRGQLDHYSSTPSQYIACQTLLAYYHFDHGFVDFKGSHDGKSLGGAKISRYGGRFKGAVVFDETGKIVIEAFRNFD